MDPDPGPGDIKFLDPDPDPDPAGIEFPDPDPDPVLTYSDPGPAGSRPGPGWVQTRYVFCQYRASLYI